MQPGDLIRQQGIVPNGQPPNLRIGIQVFAANIKDVDAVVGGRGQLDIGPPDGFAEGPELMALEGGHNENLYPLLPEPGGDKL